MVTLVAHARWVSNTRVRRDALKKKGIDPKSTWSSTNAKKNQFFETYEKDFRDQPQRTYLEFVSDGSPFIEVKIPRGYRSQQFGGVGCRL